MINLTNPHWTSIVRGYFTELQSEVNSAECDVTLVSEDRQILKAHRFVLCAGSLFLRKMLKFAHINSSPLLYMRGASGNLLRNILQFLYQGEVNIEQAHLEEFVKISNQLEIIGMTSLKSKNEKNEDFAKENDCPEGSDRDIVEYSEISRVVPKNYENMDTSQISRGLEEKLDVKMSVRSKSYMSMDHIYTDIDKQDDSTEDNDESLLAKVVDEVKKPDGRIDCNLCNKTFKNKNSLKVHKYRFHTGEKILQESLIIMT